MTEIAPGMMVECIEAGEGVSNAGVFKLEKGKKYLVISYGNGFACAKCGNCRCIRVYWGPCAPRTGNGLCVTRFRPYGGDKEVEIEQFKKINATKRLNYIDRVKNDC